MALDPLYPLKENWEVLSLAEVCSRGGGGIQTGPFGSQLHAADYVTHGIPSIMPQNITSDRISTDGIARIRDEDAQRLSKYLVEVGDIVYSRRGDVERRALVRPENDGWLCGTGCLRVRFGNGVVKPEYAAFYLSHQAARDWIVQHAVGATMPNLNTTILGALPFVLPPLSRQEEIAAILSVLDDKIELNRRMNETLEALAQAIFKDWFVDFGPTCRKAMGETNPVAILGNLIPNPSSATKTAALFPDSLGDDGLPEGWTIGNLADFTSLQNGYAFKSSDWQEIGVPVVKIGSVKPAVVDIEQVSFVSEELASQKSEFRLKVGDILVGLTGYVGETGRIPPTNNLPLLNQRVARFQSDGDFSPFVYCIVRNIEFKQFAESKAHGSAQANVSTRDLLQYAAVKCGEALLSEFNSIAGALFSKSLHNTGENRTLAETRDYLLPKLMSGEVRVRDAEKMVEGGGVIDANIQHRRNGDVR